jgi:hypothetical protein
MLKTVRATPRDNAGDPRDASSAASPQNTANLAGKQRQSNSANNSAPLSPDAIAEVDEFLLDEIFHALSLIASYTTSALEAARRGDREELRLRLRVQLRDCFRHAVEVHNLLSPGRKTETAEAGRSAA